MSHWPNGRKVTVVMREVGQSEREAVLRQIYRMREPDFNKYFLHAQFTGETLEPPKLLSTTIGVLRFVAPCTSIPFQTSAPHMRHTGFPNG